jgi:hypothetical protein
MESDMKGWTSENTKHLIPGAIKGQKSAYSEKKGEIPEGILPGNRIFIVGNVPSLKNSKQIVRTKTGLPFITSSKLCKKYTIATKMQFVNNVGKFYNLIVGPKPLRIKFYFIRKDKRKFDYINVVQILLDLMIKYEYIADDNMDEVIPVFTGYHVSKEQAGVYIYF